MDNGFLLGFRNKPIASFDAAVFFTFDIPGGRDESGFPQALGQKDVGLLGTALADHKVLIRCCHRIGLHNEEIGFCDYGIGIDVPDLAEQLHFCTGSPVLG